MYSTVNPAYESWRVRRACDDAGWAVPVVVREVDGGRAAGLYLGCLYGGWEEGCWSWYGFVRFVGRYDILDGISCGIRYSRYTRYIR